MSNGAKFTSNRLYRYVLWRKWSRENHRCMFIMLNPSTADETKDDPTIIRCINYAKLWGYGGIYVTNLFAFRSTDPKKLYNAKDPIGVDNDYWIKHYSEKSEIVIAAWGNHGAILDRSSFVKKTFSPSSLFALKQTKCGEPCHPLYLKKNLTPYLIN